MAIELTKGLLNMLEVESHQKLKQILRQIPSSWPHNLTLTRLIGRSLRRQENSLIQINIETQISWWLGLLIPIHINNQVPVIVLSKHDREYLIKKEAPYLQDKGLKLNFWEGENPPQTEKIWIMNYVDFLSAYEKGKLESRQIVIPSAESINKNLREAMSINIKSNDWEELINNNQSEKGEITRFYNYLSRKLFAQTTSKKSFIKIDISEIYKIKQLIRITSNLPKKWDALLKTNSSRWAFWAETNKELLTWEFRIQPLEPIENPTNPIMNLPFILIFQTNCTYNPLKMQLRNIAQRIKVQATIGGAIINKPIQIFAPSRQPMPNSNIFIQHLIKQSKRLIISYSGTTVLVIDYKELLLQATAALASEFGKRVLYEEHSLIRNQILCCSSHWWEEHQQSLPKPNQLIIGVLPIASLSTPLTAARVECFKRQGRNWFKDLLLPEAINKVTSFVMPLRNHASRIAILDGRIRSRDWGMAFFSALEPWENLEHLIPC